MKDSGSYANPINSSFQKFRTTSDPVTFIDVLFAVVVSLGLSQIMDRPWFNPTSANFVPAYAFEIFVVLLGYSTLLLSWWGYHRSIRRKRTYEGGWLSVFRFIVDITILN